MALHRCGNNLYTTLAVDALSTDTALYVAPSGLDDLAVPFFSDVGGEIVEVLAVTEDSPSPGTTKWDVNREVYGSAWNYSAGVPVAQRNYAEQTNELQDAFLALWTGVLFTLGGDSGVISQDGTTSCLVESGTGVSVDVGFGVAVVDGGPVLVAPSSISLTVPPAGSVNYQILIDSTGAASANEETAGQPAPEGFTILADVTVSSGDTSIDPSDISDRRSIL